MEKIRNHKVKKNNNQIGFTATIGLSDGDNID